jgi:hypothetical protein
MPGLDHAVSEMTKRASSDPYGCANKSRSRGYYATDRVYHPGGTYNLAPVWVEDRASAECRYDQSLSDPRCGTCRKRGDGEKYDFEIRSKGR